MRFDGKHIVLGVTGSIAAYKACELASRLAERGAQVIPVLTQSAQHLVGAATFEALTRHRVITGLFDPVPQPEIEHIAVARRADLFLIAPATANILAKAAHGIADDWLSTTLLATRAPILFAPAMNTLMYQHPATQENIRTLQSRGCRFVGPGDGALACGDTGPGRLIDIPAILEAASIALRNDHSLEGCRVLLTAGANHEPIDPVRYIANRSSGKMAHALALEALSRGAQVTVVTGPAQVAPPHAAQVISVQTAREMFNAVKERLRETDVFIAAAAVADYRVETPAQEKHKRGDTSLQLTLEPNPDIAAYAGQHKQPGQCTVCFAAETHDLVPHAQEKRRRKNADLIVANQVGGDACAFGADTVRAVMLDAAESALKPQSLRKEELAVQLFDRIASLRANPV